MLDIIICAKFGVKKLRGLGNTRGQILESPIEMAGHPHNRVGATAQPVICCIYFMLKNQYIWIFTIWSQMYTIDTYVHSAA